MRRTPSNHDMLEAFITTLFLALSSLVWCSVLLSHSLVFVIALKKSSEKWVVWIVCWQIWQYLVLGYHNISGTSDTIRIGKSCPSKVGLTESVSWWNLSFSRRNHFLGFPVNSEVIEQGDLSLYCAPPILSSGPEVIMLWVHIPDDSLTFPLISQWGKGKQNICKAVKATGHGGGIVLGDDH